MQQYILTLLLYTILILIVGSTTRDVIEARVIHLRIDYFERNLFHIVKKVGILHFSLKNFQSRVNMEILEYYSTDGII